MLYIYMTYIYIKQNVICGARVTSKHVALWIPSFAS